jgi:hypothetical protein
MSDSFHAAFQKLRADRDIQFDFPDAQSLSQTPGWLTRLIKFLEAHGALVRGLGWLLLIAVGLLAVYLLVQFFRARRERETEAPSRPPLPAWQPSAEQARLRLSQADALADEEQFAEAVHLLLLVAIQEIGERRPDMVAPALTSREIARHPALSAMAGAVFGEIAGVVENSRFGLKLLSAEDFARCRGAFEQFAATPVLREAA